MQPFHSFICVSLSYVKTREIISTDIGIYSAPADALVSAVNCEIQAAFDVRFEGVQTPDGQRATFASLLWYSHQPMVLLTALSRLSPIPVHLKR